MVRNLSRRKKMDDVVALTKVANWHLWSWTEHAIQVRLICQMAVSSNIIQNHLDHHGHGKLRLA